MRLPRPDNSGCGNNRMGSVRKMKMIRLNNRVRRAFQGGSTGFTLIEVVIAIALIGIITVAFLNSLSTASKVLIITDERATAESLARTQMEYVKVQSYEKAPNGGEVTYEKIDINPDEFPSYTIWSVNRDDEVVTDIIGVPWDSDNSTAVYQDKGLQRIMVVIKHDNKVIVTLEDFKRQSGA